MAPKSTGQGRRRSPSRGQRQGDSPSRKSDSSKKSSGSSYESSESVKSKDSRKGPPTHPPIVHPEPVPPGYVRIKGALVRDQGEKWTPPPREKAFKDETIIPKFTLPPRQPLNKSGKEVEVVMNAYPIIKFPTKPIFQYEVNAMLGKWKESAGPDDPPEKGQYMEQDSEILRKVFYRSKVRMERLPDAIYDGKHIAWSLTALDRQLRDKFVYPSGWRRPVGSRADVHGEEICLIMSVRRKIFLGTINEWLERKRSLDETVMEALNFLDHLIRDYPAQEFTALKRSYFFENLDNHPDPEMRKIAGKSHWPLLQSGATCYRGAFQTIKPSPNGLYLNVDIAHAVFYSRTSLINIIRGILGSGEDQTLIPKLLEPILDENGSRMETQSFSKVSKRLHGLRVCPDFDGYPLANRSYTIDHLINGGAKEYMIKIDDQATGKSEKTSIYDYFHKKYNFQMKYGKTALVQMTRAGVIFPLEILFVRHLQRWPHKLDERMTADMIKWTAVKPTGRLEAILNCHKILDHANDPNLVNYGMKIGPSMIKTKARLLPNPEIQFGNVKHNPGTTGRWDLRGKKFFKSNTKPLECWGIGFIAGYRTSVKFDQVQAFHDHFEKLFKQHGGVFKNRALSIELRDDIGVAMKTLYEKTREAWGVIPQLLVIIVPDKNSFSYLRIKKSCDCRWGVPSQVLQSRHCMDNKPQYISNVLMKVNAKLGGVTSRAIPKTPASTLRPQSVIIGADVTHPMLGVWTPSLAAMCISNDPQGISYMGGCQTNGDLKEIITPENVREILLPLMLEWNATLGKGGKPPKHIYYFRDGVSESEFQEVLQKEVLAIKKVAAECLKLNSWPGKMTVIVANKRHHLRAFPKPTDKSCFDRNGNPLPGLLVNRDITSPHGWDFLLYSHAALQGTSRPVHYTVLLDEIGHKPEELENMIYEHCYQYVRSTTPVSVHPSIYYAHLISVRARHHEDIPASSGPQHGTKVPMRRELEHPRQKEKDDFREKQKEHAQEMLKGNPGHRFGESVPKPIPSSQDPAKGTKEKEEKPAPKLAGSRLLPIIGTNNRLSYKMWWI
ncbi:hypothetical protein N7509_008872 [Penicillium cosmopolitanum]|uniref:Piwi domain-containing protein n=1 Tax=Penicillium cosmopolitanum TaxID=1131564 RepID=A0A9X0B348_9EURO|nr:uncharacterized protein N7509_008872 [Penicillium cosmopolitanum]KAJ5386331.1 hypothetical protein N7509_008872 [Penicillium cosmopolitanum]